MSGFCRFSYGIMELAAVSAWCEAVGSRDRGGPGDGGQEVPPKVLKTKLRELLPSRQEWRDS